ncbi:MAG: TRAP transporter large permease subunit, partial [Deltaproteobacteria bacterium]|nr:TRAP transporter large permease subunit [Deltaproteobacteria bacterium]
MDGPILMFIIFIVAMVIGVPIPIAAGIATAYGLIHLDIPLGLLSQTAYTAFEPFPLMTIPMFVLAGQLMEKGGLSKHLINIAQQLVGAYKGGIGLVTVLGCMFFAALSGSGPATTAAIGSITIPAMIRENYSGRFAGAVSASSGALGSMIPPSNHLIIYGLVAEQSIPRLFLAGFAPGILVGILLLFVTWIIARQRNYGGTADRFSIGPLLRAFWDGKWAIGAPVIILGG